MEENAVSKETTQQTHVDNLPASPSKNNKKHIFVGVGITIFVILLSSIYFLNKKVNKQSLYQIPQNHGTGNAQTQTNQDMFFQEYGQGCQDRGVNFTNVPLAINQTLFMKPLGQMTDGHVTPTDHVYMIATDQNAPDNTYPVVMPADGTVVSVMAMPSYYIGDKKGIQLSPEDHWIAVSYSCRYFSIFIHIHKLSPKLSTAIGKLAPGASKMVNMDLHAGDVIGYVQNGFDWLPIDMQSKLHFITPSLYDREPWKIHVVDPISLYTGSLKSQLEAKSLRTALPIGGKIDYDQAGKLVGNWFRQGTNGYAGIDQNRYWDGHLAVVPDSIDPASTVVSIGNWQGIAKQFAVKGNVDPSSVSKNSGMVKYGLIGYGYITPTGHDWIDQSGHGGFIRGLKVRQDGVAVDTIALQVLDGEKLKVEKFPGKTPDQVTGFTNNAQIYER